MSEYAITRNTSWWRNHFPNFYVTIYWKVNSYNFMRKWVQWQIINRADLTSIFHIRNSWYMTQTTIYSKPLWFYRKPCISSLETNPFKICYLKLNSEPHYKLKTFILEQFYLIGNWIAGWYTITDIFADYQKLDIIFMFLISLFLLIYTENIISVLYALLFYILVIGIGLIQKIIYLDDNRFNIYV